MAVTDLVQSGADAFAAAEKAAQTVQAKMAAVSKVITDIHAGNVPGLGYLESRALAAEAKSLAGIGASLEVMLFDFHQRLTDRCNELGIDLPAPGGGDVSALGGGGGR